MRAGFSTYVPETEGGIAIKFLGYDGSRKSREIDNLIVPLTENECSLKFIDNDNNIHRIYKVNDKVIIQKITKKRI